LRAASREYLHRQNELGLDRTGQISPILGIGLPSDPRAAPERPALATVASQALRALPWRSSSSPASQPYSSSSITPPNMTAAIPFAIAGTGYGLIGFLVIIVRVLLIGRLI
jgi:hypothetical protein